ncbi:MAG: JAB domain-containing protein [Odoribacter sp.]
MDTKTIFSVKDSDFRAYSTAELIKEVASKEINKQEAFSLEEVLNSLTPAKRKFAKMIVELSRRTDITERFSVTSSRDVYRYFKPILGSLEYEEFWVVFLNQSNKVIRRMRISSGGISETAVDIRLILKNAIQCNASGMILAHNHPSGNNRPSSADDSFTKKIKEASRLMDVRVLDHLIICEECYFSYADEGKL